MKKAQKGAVMIVALMLLLVMTVLAVSGIGNSTLEQRMAGNYYHSATAFQAAEFGLRVAEQWLTTQVTTSSAWETWFKTNARSNGLYTTKDGTTPNTTEVCRGAIDCKFQPTDEDAWCSTAGCVLPKSFVTLGDIITETGTTLDTIDLPVAHQPQFIIEYLGPWYQSGSGGGNITIGTFRESPSGSAFRITVIGWGQDGTSHHVLESNVILPL